MLTSLRFWQRQDWKTTAKQDRVQIKQLKELKYLRSLLQERKVASTTEIHSYISCISYLGLHLTQILHVGKKSRDLDAPLPLTNPGILLCGSATWTLLKSDISN